jgi:predicted Zn-dependent peptidase
MSHFLEHMMFKGTGTKSAFQIVQGIDRVGGVLNAFTEKEQTCMYCTIAAEHIDLAVHTINDMLFNSTFPEDELEREKVVVINEIAEQEDIPEETAYELFLKEMWGDHSLANKITGEIENIESINREKLLAFYRHWYVPSNLIISAAGDIDIQHLCDLLEECLPDSKPKELQKFRSHPERSKSVKYVSSKFQQVQIYSGFSAATPSSVEDFYHLLVFSTSFGESMSSRLFQQLRENLGLCYSVYGMRALFTTTVLWIIYGNTSPNLLNKMLAALNQELSRLHLEPPTDKEIQDSISHLTGALILSLEDMEVRMKRMVRHYLIGGILHTAEESIKILQTINRSNIDDIINSYIHAENFNLLVYGTKNLHKRKTIQFDFGT